MYSIARLSQITFTYRIPTSGSSLQKLTFLRTTVPACTLSEFVQFACICVATLVLTVLRIERLHAFETTFRKVLLEHLEAIGQLYTFLMKIAQLANFLGCYKKAL